MKKTSKYILIIVQFAAIILIILDYFKIISNKYIPVIGYSIILISLIITLILMRKNNNE